MSLNLGWIASSEHTYIISLTCQLLHSKIEQHFDVTFWVAGDRCIICLINSMCSLQMEDNNFEIIKIKTHWNYYSRLSYISNIIIIQEKQYFCNISILSNNVALFLFTCIQTKINHNKNHGLCCILFTNDVGIVTLAFIVDTHKSDTLWNF